MDQNEEDTPVAIIDHQIQIAQLKAQIESLQTERRQLHAAAHVISSTSTQAQIVERYLHLREQLHRWATTIDAAKKLVVEWTATAGDCTNEVGLRIDALFRAVNIAVVDEEKHK
jgi:hypothetical protein